MVGAAVDWATAAGVGEPAAVERLWRAFLEGATWSAASQVNTDATTRAQFMPSLAVTPNGTGLAITWYDRRGDPADALIERWGVAAAVSGVNRALTIFLGCRPR